MNAILLYRHRFSILLHDCDSAGVMFFAHLFRHAHDLYEIFMADRGLPLDEIIGAGAFHLPIVHAEADYRRPLRHGADVEAQLVAAQVGASSFTLTARFLDAHGAEAARTTTTHVCIDPAGTPRPLPDDPRLILTGGG